MHNNSNSAKTAVFIISFLIIMLLLGIVDVVFLSLFCAIFKMAYSSFFVWEVAKKSFCTIMFIEAIIVPIPLYRAIVRFYKEREDK